METFALTEAKRRAEELFERAETGEEFLITKYGKESAVLLSCEEYSRLSEYSQSSVKPRQ